MLQIRGLGRRYGSLVALEDVSLEVAAGQIVGLLGANGAGKSTLMRTVAGLQPPDSGTIEIQDVEIWTNPVAAKSRIGYSPEEPTFYEELSADEHLSFLASLRGLDPRETRERAHDLLRRLGLDQRAHEPIHRYSHGMRKKLAFAAAVLHRPAVLLCDEALDGFDAAGALEAKEALRALAAGGCAILFSSHVTETIERLCDRAVVLHRGRVVRELERAAWGAPQPGPSPLEREFLAVLGSN